MKSLFFAFAIMVATGCATRVEHPSNSGKPSAIEIRDAFRAIVSPYAEGTFLTHAFVDGFIHAYSFGPASLGALIATPEPYREREVEEAYRLGWSEGALRIANQQMPRLMPTLPNQK